MHKDARLAKTLLVAALVPEVMSLSRLTAGRLAALNHGTRVGMDPRRGGRPGAGHRARRGHQQIGEIHIGEGNDPTISVELSGVDYESVLARVENEDTVGARRTLLRRLLFTEMGIPESSQLAFGGPDHRPGVARHQAHRRRACSATSATPTRSRTTR